MNRTSVLHIRDTSFFGGAEKQIIHHCTSMDSREWRMIVCSFLEGKPQNEFLEKATSLGLETGTLYTPCVYSPSVLWELANLIKLKKPDLIVTHGYRPMIFCLILKLFRKKPIIAYSHGYTSENFKVRIFEKLHRISLRFSELIIAVSEGHKRVLMNYGLPDNHIRVVHNATVIAAPHSGAEITQLRKDIFQRFNLPEKALLVVTAGRLSPEKGHRFLLEAISKIKQERTRVYYVFCGDGVCRESLEKQAKCLGIFEQCRFPGFQRDIMDIFQVMDFMVLPSLTEGLPVVVLEAFARAKPVVATTVGGLPEIVENGINGILVPPSQSDLLAKAILKCLSSSKMRDEMGDKAYQKVKKDFTFELQTKKLEKIYNDVLSGNK